MPAVSTWLACGWHVILARVCFSTFAVNRRMHGGAMACTVPCNPHAATCHDPIALLPRRRGRGARRGGPGAAAAAGRAEPRLPLPHVHRVRCYWATGQQGRLACTLAFVALQHHLAFYDDVALVSAHPLSHFAGGNPGCEGASYRASRRIPSYLLFLSALGFALFCRSAASCPLSCLLALAPAHTVNKCSPSATAAWCAKFPEHVIS